MLTTPLAPANLRRLAGLLIFGCGAACASLSSTSARAGLTASEVVVVINGSSADSRTLGNHYVRLRGIPAINVIVLDQIPDSETITVEEFRTKLLGPLFTEISRRQLAGHVQCIAYSTDFPTAVDISADLEKLENRPQFMTNKGSINGLTYLYLNVTKAEPFYADLNSNFYARREVEVYLTNPAGSLSAESWAKIQQLIADGQHSDASREFESLLAEQPHQFPMAYLAAAEAALANEEGRAVKLMQTAVNLGWNAGGYMAHDIRLDSIRDNPVFQTLSLLVDDHIVEFQPSVGFNARTHWTPNGVPIDGPLNTASRFGLRYILSTVLGVTRGSGTNLSQAIAALQRSASADFTHPSGGFYFCATKDVRSTTRQWNFLDAVDNLKAMGYDAELVTDPLPKNKPAVLGVQSGTPTFSWSASGSKFVPGAIADNLTSFGGVMTAGSSQTKLTEFIKGGAAGSSGTVTEPYSIPQKFPLPQLYVHYARGASLAEAFYMSVAGPYQLLIVGDPLCRPFSNAPAQDIGNDLRFMDKDALLQLQLDLTGPSYEDWLELGTKRAKQTKAFAPAAVSVLFDGVNPQTRPTRPNLNLKLNGLSSGYHEVILRFASSDPLVQKHESLIPVWIGDRQAISLNVSQQNPRSSGQAESSVAAGGTDISVQVTAPNAKRVTLWHDWEQLAMANGDQAEFSIAPGLLGSGPIRLQARAELDAETTIQSIPQWLEVAP